MGAERAPEDLSPEERQRLHRAHQRLRNASQALEALTVIEKVRGRWEARPAPPEALEAAGAELADAYDDVCRTQAELLGWAPAGSSGD